MGNSVTPTLQQAFARSIAPIYEAYGATEIAPASWNRPGEVSVGSIGKPGKCVEFRLVDISRCKGPRWIRRRNITSAARISPQVIGRSPRRHARPFKNGWFRSGDLATRDDDGFYWFAGRKKEIIIRGGSNISPQEVEAAIYEHSAVAEVGVVGKKDPSWGEIVVAHVALRPGQQLVEQELIAFARERLADYKVPATVIFHSQLPKGATGKIQRSALREKKFS